MCRLRIMRLLISASTSNRQPGSYISACRGPISWCIVWLECRGQCRWLLPFWSNIEEWPIVRLMGWSRVEGRSSILMMGSSISSKSSKEVFLQQLERNLSPSLRRRRIKEGITRILVRLINRIGWISIVFYRGMSPSKRHFHQTNWEILNPNMRSSVRVSPHRRVRLDWSDSLPWMLMLIWSPRGRVPSGETSDNR